MPGPVASEPTVLSFERRWKIEWELPQELTLGDLAQILEDLRGCGMAEVQVRNGMPFLLEATFTTTPEWNEFDLHGLLIEVQEGNNAGSPGRPFPTRPTEIR